LLFVATDYMLSSIALEGGKIQGWSKHLD